MKRRQIHVEAIGMRCQYCEKMIGSLMFLSKTYDPSDSHDRKQDTLRIMVDNDVVVACEDCTMKGSVPGTVHDQEVNYDRYKRIKGVTK
jgi:hypothetical protein